MLAFQRRLCQPCIGEDLRVPHLFEVRCTPAGHHHHQQQQRHEELKTLDFHLRACVYKGNYTHIFTPSRAQMDGWMDPIGNQHLDLGNEQAPYRDGRRIPRR